MSSPTLRASLLSVLMLGIAWPSHVAAQSLTDFCPEADPATEAGVIGVVSDPESGMALPGAEVVVSWLSDGTRQRVEVPTGIDGVYMACGLPQDVDMQVRAPFGDRRGQWVDFSTETVLQQHDLPLSLTGKQPEEEIELSEDSKRSNAFTATSIDDEDLAQLPEMTL